LISPVSPSRIRKDSSLLVNELTSEKCQETLCPRIDDVDLM